jgi:rhodanese-related sulfurtransferase
MKEPQAQIIKMVIFISLLAAVLAFFNYLHHDAKPVENAPPEGSRIQGIISTKELTHLIEHNTNLLILDARVDWYYEEGHIPSAENLPAEEFDKYYPRLKEKITKATHVVLYCADRGCDSSKILAATLRKHTHTNILIYLGGWKEWKASGGQTEK